MSNYDYETRLQGKPDLSAGTGAFGWLLAALVVLAVIVLVASLGSVGSGTGPDGGTGAANPVAETPMPADPATETVPAAPATDPAAN